MRKSTKFLAMAMGVGMCFSVAACGGEKAPEGSVNVEFWYDISGNRTNYYKELIGAYNDGQGKEDGVYVVGKPRSGIAEKAYTNLSKKSVNANVYTLGGADFIKLAMEGYLLELDEYVKNSAGNLDLTDIPETIINRYRFNGTKNDAGKYEAGKGASLVAMPNGIRAGALFYHTGHFETAGINVISVTETELETSTTYQKVMPHGYAEYASEPFSGAKTSTNLAGETVYKVFNNLIPMNWEEFRYLAKTFTRDYEYNPQSPSKYGYMTEYWYNVGWSVGGDCIGWDGEKYNFTLGDSSANYLATKDVTINGNSYHAGEIVAYEDKIKESGIDSKVGADGGLYRLPSQRDALIEFLKFGVAPAKEVETGEAGYGILDMNERGVRAQSLSSGSTAVYYDTIGYCNSLLSSKQSFCDAAPAPQYRVYQGGSTYQKNGQEGFANEYLKVIGKDGYTGELLKENGTAIVGDTVAYEAGESFVIPKNSDSAKYEAAWKFIRYAAGKEGQTILSQSNMDVPNQISLMDSDTWLNASDKTIVNRKAFAMAAKRTSIGDQVYFENNEWVSAWANGFNGNLRLGELTVTNWLKDVQGNADNALAAKTIVYKGVRGSK